MPPKDNALAQILSGVTFAPGDALIDLSGLYVDTQRPRGFHPSDFLNVCIMIESIVVHNCLYAPPPEDTPPEIEELLRLGVITYLPDRIALGSILEDPRYEMQLAWTPWTSDDFLSRKDWDDTPFRILALNKRLISYSMWSGLQSDQSSDA